MKRPQGECEFHISSLPEKARLALATRLAGVPQSPGEERELNIQLSILRAICRCDHPFDFYAMTKAQPGDFEENLDVLVYAGLVKRWASGFLDITDAGFDVLVPPLPFEEPDE